MSERLNLILKFIIKAQTTKKHMAQLPNIRQQSSTQKEYFTKRKIGKWNELPVLIKKIETKLY